MKKELFKITATAFSLTLVLVSVGCSSKMGGTDKAEDEALPTVAQEEETICESSG